MRTKYGSVKSYAIERTLWYGMIEVIASGYRIESRPVMHVQFRVDGATDLDILGEQGQRRIDLVR
ncbi:hypothetical protein HYG81_21050 (plasmid) [Natrinema zhouii]|uniref:hypothetical protein n=1 Tax=Natrinema zhouii TaxID=1710539 RepID=UPI001CFF9D04|nr:hypothetical protein [Natrinema zhouii]UHQ98089.1 hypothetical protein HYG81_21050 [Natrinema zhouii]